MGALGEFLSMEWWGQTPDASGLTVRETKRNMDTVAKCGIGQKMKNTAHQRKKEW